MFLFYIGFTWFLCIHVFFFFSYYHCLRFQAYLLFGDEEYLFIFQEAYAAAMHHLYNDPW